MARYSDAFNIALAHVLEFEGGYSDHPSDPGGKTFKGITLETLRRAWNNPKLTARELKALTHDEIAKIYHDMYWLAVRGDQLPAAIAVQMFDAAVNSGPANAIKALQASLAKWSGAKIAADGVIGPKTLAAVKGVKLPRLVRSFAARRMVFYGLLKTFRVFGFGWAERLMAGLSLAQALITAARPLLSPEEGKTS